MDSNKQLEEISYRYHDPAFWMSASGLNLGCYMARRLGAQLMNSSGVMRVDPVCVSGITRRNAKRC